MSDACRARLWALWRAGKGFSAISRQIGYPPGSIFTVIRQTGGYVPATRTRRAQYLSAAEREVSRRLARGRVVAGDRPGVGAGAVDDQPGGGPQPRPAQVPGGGRRGPGMATGSATATMPAGAPGAAAAAGGGQAAGGLVAAADRRILAT